MVQLTNAVQVVINESTKEKHVNTYRLDSTVGRGTFSKVKWAVDTSGNGYAVKVFSRSVMERRQVAVFTKAGADRVSFEDVVRAELQLLQGLQHQHIVLLHEIIDDPEHEDMYVIYGGMPGGTLMEYCDACCGYTVNSQPLVAGKYWSDVLSYTDAGNNLASGEVSVFTESLAQYVFSQLLEAVVYLHGQGIIHKDLKPENVLLSLPLPVSDTRFCRKLSNLQAWPALSLESHAQAAGAMAVDEEAEGSASSTDCASFRQLLQRAGLSLRICDFGNAVLTEPPDHLIYDAQGTHLFTPPECFLHGAQGFPGKSRDIWSLGCILFCMLYGRCPFWEADNFALQMSIIDATLILPEGIVSASAMDLIKGLTKKDAAGRLTAALSLQHPWISIA